MHVQSTAFARVRALELSPTTFRRLAVATLGALWLIVITGAAVRLTDSGLGCRHWPGCERGNPLPAKDYHAFIEFGNRVVGGVVILLTLAVWLAATRTPGLAGWARRLALAIFAGTALQAPLGYVTVASDLHWPFVVGHLLLSIALLGGAVVLALEARGLERGHTDPLVPVELRRLGYALVASCFALVVSGSLATAAGPHSGGGEEIDRFASLRPVVYSHAFVVGVFLCVFVLTLGYLAAVRQASPRLAFAAAAVAALLLVQMALGELQWRTHLPWGLVLVHVAVAATVWGGTVALATLFRRPLAAFAPE